MLRVEEARERILSKVAPLEALELPVTEAHGCVLAEAVTAPEDLPSFASSAMDGYAVRSEDTTRASASPVSLTIIGESAAGKPFTGRLGFGESVRTLTGAAIPDGADAIVKQEDVAVVGSSLAIGRPVPPREHIRPSGEDVKRGEVVFAEGQRLRGMDVGVLAALGRQRVLVRPRPRVVVLSTGDELKEPGQPLLPGEIRDSNSFAVRGMARECGATPAPGGIVRDEPRALREKILAYLPQADAFVVSGGVSVGDHDHVRGVLQQIGEVDFWQVAVKPGKPLAFGFVEGRPFFGLPGNPVSATVTFELFVRPALMRMCGRRTLFRPEVEARFEETVRQAPGRETYLRVRAWRDDDGWHAKLAGGQGSNLIASVAKANALAVIPADRDGLASGEPVRLVLLEPLEGW